MNKCNCGNTTCDIIVNPMMIVLCCKCFNKAFKKKFPNDKDKVTICDDCK